MRHWCIGVVGVGHEQDGALFTQAWPGSASILSNEIEMLVLVHSVTS